MFVYASHNAALFPRRKRFALEGVDAVIEAALDEVGVHVHEFLHLLPLHAVLELALLLCVKAVHSEFGRRRNSIIRMLRGDVGLKATRKDIRRRKWLEVDEALFGRWMEESWPAESSSKI